MKKVVENQKLFKKFNYIKGDASLREVAIEQLTTDRLVCCKWYRGLFTITFDENIYYGKLESILLLTWL